LHQIRQVKTQQTKVCSFASPQIVGNCRKAEELDQKSLHQAHARVWDSQRIETYKQYEYIMIENKTSFKPAIGPIRTEQDSNSALIEKASTPE
jgi:hypothetical protein